MYVSIIFVSQDVDLLSAKLATEIEKISKTFGATTQPELKITKIDEFPNILPGMPYLLFNTPLIKQDIEKIVKMYNTIILKKDWPPTQIAIFYHPNTLPMNPQEEMLRQRADDLSNEIAKYPNDQELKQSLIDIRQKLRQFKGSIPSKQIKLHTTDKFPELEKKIGSFDCSIEMVEKIWNDSNYGPIIASLIFSGCEVENINPKALQNTWISLRQSFRISNATFVSLYSYLSKQMDYTYCNKQYNFLVDFYEKGMCNCECGSLLSYKIAQEFPVQNFSTFLLISPRHMQCMICDRNGVMKTFETTVKGGQLIPTDISHANLAILEEQIVAVYIILGSYRDSILKLKGKTLFEQMFSCSLNDTIGNVLRKMNRKVVRNFLDSNSLDLIVCQLYFYVHIEYQFGKIMDALEVNNKKYLSSDILLVSKHINPSQQELQNRLEQHITEIEQIANSMKNK